MKSAHPPLEGNVRFYPQQNQQIRDKTSKSCRKYVLLAIIQTWDASPCQSTIRKKEKLMIEQCFSRTSVITRLQLGPLGSHLDALATTLHQHGYALDSIRRALRAGDQFGRWLSQQGYTIAEVDEALVERYISALSRPPSGRGPKAAEGLPHLLQLWRQHDLLPSRTCAPS